MDDKAWDYLATRDERIRRAVDIAVRFGGSDGEHHKDWVIDQMVRALTGCPMVKMTAKDCNGKEYEFEAQGESEEYQKLVRDACEEDGDPNAYHWDVGIPP